MLMIHIRHCSLYMKVRLKYARVLLLKRQHVNCTFTLHCRKVIRSSKFPIHGLSSEPEAIFWYD